MNYVEVIDFLYQQLPVFHREGKKAFKPGLDNIIALCELFGNPQDHLKCLHIAGTNGKGSSSHLMASVLQAHGFKVGLYTSPHLKNFTERFKINGQEIPESWIIDFVNENKERIQNTAASFFEWTVVMAFQYFKEEQVDFAVIETGLGGRLDSTNIIQPIASLITNISFDHQDILGNTLPEIAFEKAGIIKEHTPVTISEKQNETTTVFLQKSEKEHAPIQFAEEVVIISPEDSKEGRFQQFHVHSAYWGTFLVQCPLLGNYQLQNIRGIIAWCQQIDQQQIIRFNVEKIQEGIKMVLDNTQLKGRFQVIQKANPCIIADTAHNEAGIRLVLNQIEQIKPESLTIVIGMVKDKDVNKVLELLPQDANYLFTQIHNPRALKASELEEIAKKTGKSGIHLPNVNEAIDFVRKNRSKDFVLIIGSTYLVAEINEL